MHEPAEYAAEIERDPTVPAGSGERFCGYGVMGLPFRSGHILGLRRFPASSVGPGYSSIWHRSSDLGAMGPARERAQLRDFAIPQRDLFVVGRASFDAQSSRRLRR